MQNARAMQNAMVVANNERPLGRKNLREGESLATKWQR